MHRRKPGRERVINPGVYMAKHNDPVGSRAIMDAMEPRILLASITAQLSADGTLTVTGTDGADTIVVGTAVRDLPGGDNLVEVVVAAGRDFVQSSVQRVVILAGGGNDTIDCSAVPPTFDLDDTKPLNNAAFIDAGAGDDSINATSLDDTIIGGTGDDTIQGGSGVDRIAGGEGNDSISGNAQADRIDGGVGADFLNGHGGRDKLSGGG